MSITHKKFTKLFFKVAPIFLVFAVVTAGGVLLAGQKTDKQASEKNLQGAETPNAQQAEQSRTKIIDPLSDGFDPESFRFEDYFYSGKKELAHAIGCMFPPGTPKSYVEHIVMERGGAEKRLEPQSNSMEHVVYFYTYEHPYGDDIIRVSHKVAVYYQDGNVVKTGLSGTGYTECKPKGEKNG